jgi:putative addiction module component (TIGR02574 family)
VELMKEPLDRVEAEALRLPVQDRARLAPRLLESLDEIDDPREVEGAWKEEIEKRLAEYAGGAASTIPASLVFREARDRLRRR